MKENFIKVEGNNIRYLESGDSENILVLIHGLGASAERWDRVFHAFSQNYRVIAPDLIGFGYSDKPMVDYTPDFFSEFIGKLFIELKIKKPNIIGSSMGGQIVAEYTAANPENIDKMILVSPAGIMKQSTPALDAYIMASLYPNEESAKNAFELMESSGAKVDDKIIHGFIERMQLPNAKLAFMSTVLGMKNSEIITSKLAKIPNHTLLIWGEKDPVLPIQYAESFRNSIRHCTFHKMDGCGHTPYVQKPDIFSSLVLNFLSNN